MASVVAPPGSWSASSLITAADEYAPFVAEAGRAIAHDLNNTQPGQVLDRLGVDPNSLVACPDPGWSKPRFVEMTCLLHADPAIVRNRVLDRLKPAK